MRRLAVAAGRRPATTLVLARGSWTAEMSYLHLQLLYKVKQLEMHTRPNEETRPRLLLAAALITGHRTCGDAHFLIAV